MPLENVEGRTMAIDAMELADETSKPLFHLVI